MKHKKEMSPVDLLARYLLLVVLAVFNLAVIYAVFTPLTLYPSYFLINLLVPSALVGNFIIAGCGAIELIDACIAGSAYYLLFILNLSTPNMEIKKRLSAISFSLLAFLLANILRIFLFSMFFFAGLEFFSTAHLIFWYGISTLLVFLIWLAEIKLFQIREIPFYTDIAYLIRKIKSRR